MSSPSVAAAALADSRSAKRRKLNSGEAANAASPPVGRAAVGFSAADITRRVIYESDIIYGVHGNSCTDTSGTVKLKVTESSSGPDGSSGPCAATGAYRLQSITATVHGTSRTLSLARLASHSNSCVLIDRFVHSLIRSTSHSIQANVSLRQPR